MDKSLSAGLMASISGMFGDASKSSSPEDLKNRDLAGRLRSGDAPEGTLECLKETVANKLKVASPRYLERYENEM